MDNLGESELNESTAVMVEGTDKGAPVVEGTDKGAPEPVADSGISKIDDCAPISDDHQICENKSTVNNECAEEQHAPEAETKTPSPPPPPPPPLVDENDEDKRELSPATSRIETESNNDDNLLENVLNEEKSTVCVSTVQECLLTEDNEIEEDPLLTGDDIECMSGNDNDGKMSTTLARHNENIQMTNPIEVDPLIDDVIPDRIEDLLLDDKIEENAEANIEPNVVEEDFESNVEESVEPNTEEKIESNLDDKVESNIEERIESNIEKTIESNIEERIESNIEEKIESNLEENVESTIEANVESIIKDNPISPSNENLIESVATLEKVALDLISPSENNKTEEKSDQIVDDVIAKGNEPSAAIDQILQDTKDDDQKEAIDASHNEPENALQQEVGDDGIGKVIDNKDELQESDQKNKNDKSETVATSRGEISEESRDESDVVPVSTAAASEDNRDEQLETASTGAEINEEMQIDFDNTTQSSLEEILDKNQSSNNETEEDKDNDECMDVTDNNLSDSDKMEQSINDIEFVELPCGEEDTTEDKTGYQSEDGDKESDGETQRENTVFVRVDLEGKDDDDKDTGNVNEILEEDPIASDGFIGENQQGADEELCIIPDTERVLSQEEKEAAFSIPPLRDLTETAASVLPEDQDSGETIEPSIDDSSNQTNKFVISKCLSEELQTCLQCILKRKAQFTVEKNKETQYICNEACLEAFKNCNSDNYILNWEKIRVKNLMAPKEPPKLAFDRKCAKCQKKTNDNENNLTWEIMDFCNEFCLSKYQKEIGGVCANCSQSVRPNSLGKYCVRFGNDIRQFCSSHCLEEFKKGLKVCSYCQRDMSSSSDGFLAPVGDKGQFKDFCSQVCMEKYDVMTNNRPPNVEADVKCSVCKGDKAITIEYDSNYFCSDRCFIAFSFVNNISASKCSMCRRYVSNEVLEKNTMFYDNVQHSFCSNSCQNIYIIAHRKIVPCAWCKVKKYNFDMIRRYLKNGPVINMCSINCFSLFQVSVNAVSSKKTQCNFCTKRHQPMYHLTMSDATIRNFCSYSCVMSFQNKYKTPLTLGKEDDFPVPTGEPKKNRKYTINEASTSNDTTESDMSLPVISSVQSLATQNQKSTRSKASNANATPQHVLNAPSEPPKVVYKQLVIIKPEPIPDQRNVATMCKVKSDNKNIQIKVVTHEKSTQTEQREAEKVLIPIPVPVYVPSPLPMYSVPVPYPLPFALPIPVPIFIPTTRNSAKGIMKEIKKIQVKIPTDPYEAELLMMAEMVAGDKKEENTDSESDVDDNNGGGDEGGFSPEPVDASNTFGDDMLQMALKMATELEEPAVDLEGALTATTITAPQGSDAANEEAEDSTAIQQLIERPSGRGRKRGSRGGRHSSVAKRRRMSQPVDMPMMPTPPAPPPEPAEKPDAHFCLKYTFGVNAWKQWVTIKNSELEKSSKYPKLFKTEILQLTADELNYSLCLFVKEVRKPNGAEYAPDTIYYLCLGIQQYLFENNRIDNIFCDPYYEQFTDSLDEVAKKFSVLYNDSHYIVTRVEEEHLWESKQLGAHSPHVLLSTLMFFNTKHFNLTTVEEHMQLSFSHIMKHWKRNPNQSGVARTPGSRNVLLRFYPPQTAMQSNTRKKKVYEQQENDENPLRCPVKLYEFYLSKCPESVKTRNDVFYLQPERSCVPDSPVWYSTSPLCREALEKMLHRVKMVKEINVALLTS